MQHAKTSEMGISRANLLKDVMRHINRSRFCKPSRILQGQFLGERQLNKIHN